MRIEDIHSAIDRFKYEKELYYFVQNGDINSTKMILDNFVSYIRNNYQDDNKYLITRLKYICITAISIYSRMAIEKGKSVSESYKLADSLFKEVEYTRTLQDVLDIVIKSTEEFVKFNFERDDLYSLPIRKAIDYINSNINNKITISDINKESGLSNDYLSVKFKDEVGINIKDYIMNKKLDKAKNELDFNQYDKNIYKRYGFSTQSYFIKCFKNKYGTTPKDYYYNIIEKTMI